MFTMRPPPCFRMTGRTARFMFTMPKKFTSNCRRASCVGVNSIAPEMPKPALLMRMSMRPSRCRTSATAASTCASSVTSACRCITPGSAFSARRLSSYTFRPRPRRARAACRPMPELPPVMTATRASVVDAMEIAFVFFEFFKYSIKPVEKLQGTTCELFLTSVTVRPRAH